MDVDLFMKIAILVNTFYNGRGMDYVAEQQALELKSKGYDITIFTFDYDHELDGIPMIKLKWPKIYTLNLIYRLFFPFDIFKILHYSNNLKKYDLIIAHFFPITFLAYCVKIQNPNIKYVFYDHGIENTKCNPLSLKLYRELIRILTRVSNNNADCIISISHYIQNEYKGRVNKKMVIYNKVDPERFIYKLNEIRESLESINDNNPKFLYVGVLSQYKGINLLLKSFRAVLDVFPNARLIIVGKASYGFKLDTNLSNQYDNKNFLFLSGVSNAELGYLYNICDVYVTASLWEGFNLPLVEAQSLGKPVVAFDVGSHKEVMKDNKTGFLVEPFDTKNFAEKMVIAYNDKKNLGENAKQWSARFSIHNNKMDSISDILDNTKRSAYIWSKKRTIH